jgi:hypothetical protein
LHQQSYYSGASDGELKFTLTQLHCIEVNIVPRLNLLPLLHHNLTLLKELTVPTCLTLLHILSPQPLNSILAVLIVPHLGRDTLSFGGPCFAKSNARRNTPQKTDLVFRTTKAASSSSIVRKRKENSVPLFHESLLKCQWRITELNVSMTLRRGCNSKSMTSMKGLVSPNVSYRWRHVSDRVAQLLPGFD